MPDNVQSDWRNAKKPAHERRGRELRRLLPRHQRIMALHMAGMKPSKIASLMGLTNGTINMITSSPIFQDELSRRQANVEAKEDEALAVGTSRAREIIDEASASAAQTQVSLLDDLDSRVKHSAAKDILNRALGPTGDSTPRVGTIVLEEGAIQLIKLTLNEVREDLAEGANVDERNRLQADPV